MSAAVKENEALVRRWVEVWNTGNVAAIDDLVAADYVRHDPNTPEVRGPAAERQLAAMYLAAFPDLRFTVEDLIAAGDRVMARLTAHATHQGELLGIPPTGNAVKIEMIESYRIADGRIAEQWVVMDTLGMLQQLGAIPTMGGAGS